MSDNNTESLANQAETVPAAAAPVQTASDNTPAGEKIGYTVFIAVVAVAIVAGMVLPPLLNVPNAKVERAIMAGMVPFLIFVLIKLR